jgi:tetraacyldisaccharide 4'-kinase
LKLRGWFENTVASIWFAPDSSTSSGTFVTRLLSIGLRLVGIFSHSTIVNKSTRQARSRHLSSGSGKPSVVVVGNLIVGGAGKTPLVIAIGTAFAARNLRVGYIASGYGSPAYDTPQLLDRDCSASTAGDEPFLIFKTTNAPVAVGKDRAGALKILSDAFELDVVISDDGLQHEALRRDVEIVVFDERFAGNERLLPAGPLREPLSRLASTDAVFAPERLYSRVNEFINLTRTDLSTTTWQLDGFCGLQDYAKDTRPLLLDASSFALQVSDKTLHAIAGIADPKKFFSTLQEHGIIAQLHAPGDHTRMDTAQLKMLGKDPVVMTEKDAVKYLQLIESPEIDMVNFWVAIGHAEINESCIDLLLRRVTSTE